MGSYLYDECVSLPARQTAFLEWQNLWRMANKAAGLICHEACWRGGQWDEQHSITIGGHFPRFLLRSIPRAGKPPTIDLGVWKIHWSTRPKYEEFVEDGHGHPAASRKKSPEDFSVRRKVVLVPLMGQIESNLQKGAVEKKLMWNLVLIYQSKLLSMFPFVLNSGYLYAVVLFSFEVIKSGGVA